MKRFSNWFLVALIATSSIAALTKYLGMVQVNNTLKSFNPNDPTASGYTLVFDDEFNSLSTILTTPANDYAPPGYNWYVTDTTLTPPLRIEFNSAANSNVLVIGTVNSSNYDYGSQLKSAGLNYSVSGNLQKWQNKWNGHTFGGGAYFEARIGFDETLMPGYDPTTNPHHSWPGFWSNDISAIVNNGAEFPYPGQPTYMNAVEDDFFEWPFNGTTEIPPNLSTSSLHNWVGIYEHATCAEGSVSAAGRCDFNNHGQGSNFDNYQFSIPFHNWTAFHIIGQLWVPATFGNGANDCVNVEPPWNSMPTGFVQNYVDGIPYTRTFWCGTIDASPTPNGYSIFSALDLDHLFLNLQGSVNAPVMFDWVHVWQLPAALAESGNSAVSPQPGFTGGNGSGIIP
jgi:hypothetical protein